MRRKFIKIRIKEEMRKNYKIIATEEFDIIGNPLQTSEKAHKAKHHKDDKKTMSSHNCFQRVIIENSQIPFYPQILQTVQFPSTGNH